MPGRRLTPASATVKRLGQAFRGQASRGQAPRGQAPRGQAPGINATVPATGCLLDGLAMAVAVNRQDRFTD